MSELHELVMAPNDETVSAEEYAERLPYELRRNVEHWVYRCWDENGWLLYIGATNGLKSRMYHHKSRSPWWGDVRRITTTSYSNRSYALAAESAAIADESPLYNKRI